MFERIFRGWELAKQSLNVLLTDKKLLVFPLLSGIACVLVLVSFAVPLFATGFAAELAQDGPNGNEGNNIVGIAVLFAFYLANYFVIVFFNSALVACAFVRLQGGEPTLGMGLNAAMNRLPQIFGWAVVAACVGTILQVIESRSEKFGAIVASLLGMAWSIVTFFVIPVIVIEKSGPIKALQRSTAILRKSWGESLTANFGVSTIAFLLSLPAIVGVVAGGALAAGGNVVLGVAIVGLSILALLAVSLVSSAMIAILLAALYLYATTSRVPGAFDERLLADAFTRK